MVRSSKLNNQRAKEEPIEQLLEIILEDVIKAGAMPFDHWLGLSRHPLVPLAIPVDVGRQYRVTQVGVDAAHKLTRQEWRKRKTFRQTIANSEFDKLSFRAIGETILGCRSHLPNDGNKDQQLEESFFAAMAVDYTRNLERLADAIRPTVDRHIPCHLFHTDQGVPPFSVGPVEFLPRADWIARHVKNATQLERIKEVDEGEMSYDDLRAQAFAQNGDRDLLQAWQVLSSLSNFGWVATIRMEDHELAQSHHKASIIVGLAIDAIGLRFQVEDARRFTKAGRQHLFSESRIATLPDGGFIRGGGSAQMPGLGSGPGALIAKLEAEQRFLEAAGKVLQAYLEGRQTGSAPHLVERWANALYWFGEARRESSDFMATVKYGCAADVLSGAGGDASEMTTFAKAALNPKGMPTPQGALGIADAVNKVYREGRNKLAHGEMEGLLEDLSEPRAVGDSLLMNLFDAVTFELATIIDQRPQILGVPEAHAFRALKERFNQRK